MEVSLLSLNNEAMRYVIATQASNINSSKEGGTKDGRRKRRRDHGPR